MPGSAFTRSGGAGAAIGDQVDEAAVARLFADGTTIVLQALHRIWPPVIEFATDLRAELGHPVQVNAYVTPSSSRGFSAHYDLHDVFVLQVAGEKRWIVHEPAFEAPLRTQPWTERRADVERTVSEQEPLLDVVLRPGDALYLPRGFVHAAEALGETCAHLTVGIHVITRHALVEALAALAVDDLELRRSLPLGLDLGEPASFAADLEATVDALAGDTRSRSTRSCRRSAAEHARRRLRGRCPSPRSRRSPRRVGRAGARGFAFVTGFRRAWRRPAAGATLELPTGTLAVRLAASPLRSTCSSTAAPMSSRRCRARTTRCIDLVATLLLESVVVPADD